MKEDFSKACWDRTHWTLKPYKIPIIGIQSQNQTPPTLISLIIKGLNGHQRIEWRMLSCFDDPLAPIINIRS
ncbi:hypothetical protein F7208_03645 [Helicobacter pylori]|nr:hypothetical protein [Helicobacter pylori]